MRTPRQWSDVFFDIAHAIAQRSKDPSTQCGAVIVSPDHTVLGIGFNGPPPQFNDEEIPWEKRPEKYYYIEHAEENALHYALSAHGSGPLKGAYVFVTNVPCVNCTRKLIRSNIKRVFYPDNAPEYKLTNPVTIENLIDALGYPAKGEFKVMQVPYTGEEKC